MDEVEEKYSMHYLYNAVTEFMYFIMIFIEKYGPTDINAFAEYMKFFKSDVAEFTANFNGKTFLEKLGDMLFTTTTNIFEFSEDKILCLKQYKHFKESIFESLVISKSVDLILKGIINIKDICNNINLCNMIDIEKSALLNILEKSSCFYVYDNSVVCVLHVRELPGVTEHAYDTVIHYFQSLLNDIKFLPYHQVIYHCTFVPCAVQNLLVIFCIFHYSDVFKCKNGHVILKKKGKKTGHLNVPINPQLISTNSSHLGAIVQEVHGEHLQSWVGDITELKKTSGCIYCVVDFTNYYQGTFIVYFSRKTLKQICEIEDLRNYFSIRDTVEFDAKYWEEGKRCNIYWQATKIKVIKRSCKHRSKLEMMAEKENLESDIYLQYYVSSKLKATKFFHQKCFRNDSNVLSNITKNSASSSFDMD